MTAQWGNIAFDRSAKPPVPMRLYEGKSKSQTPPLVLYLRGGAFLSQARDRDEQPAARAIADTGAAVLEADYGSASQNLFPQALEYAFAALQCLSRHRRQFGAAKSLLLVAGDEAGGNVAAGVALKARDQMPGELDGQILLSPMIDPLMATASFQKADEIGMRERWSDGWSHYLSSRCGFQHPYAAPCLCSRLAGVAPALVVTADDDPLRDEALGYAERLRAAGVSVRKHVFPAGSGWTGIYKDGDGEWLTALGTEFTGFVKQLSS
ncbi:alpha/beta hydrolase fold domain-containing protein [Rhizobium cremeum]|uniref:alpha/beta hydrolase n=1 Tax=Rhizobium cremeum TaxID=2813827 RepID=UPI000DDE86B5|nr:alpha/beta hydrolase [Rhizobium cremeum]MCJ7997400.1 alpha/beta hydrolase fold domain-containing protein [Rhizobium cremeum]MCJ8002494.1 alpha/beta hydrolase fold domain-containing protein [Rhizobium cremeum]